jgi:broad specificity phosphatase PhoE
MAAEVEGRILRRRSTTQTRTRLPTRCICIFVLCLVPLLISCQSDPVGSATVVLVRHAEKMATGGSDPDLTEDGVERANALAEALRDSDVDAIISTHFKRTLHTAEPLAARTGITPTIMKPDGGLDVHVREVADAVRTYAGGTVVVVGHSNTIPAIITALGGPSMPDMGESEYASLFVLTLHPAGEVGLVRASYGAPDG